jgi:uncharacterized DUF497 family protein
MVFEWDEMKSLANAKTRGLPFEIAMALLTDRHWRARTEGATMANGE